MQISSIKVALQKKQLFTKKNKTSKEEKFDAKMSIRIDKHIFGLDEKVTIPCK